MIQKLLESFLVVLKRYVLERRPENGVTWFAKMLVMLTEIRSISVQFSLRLLQYRHQRGHEQGELLQLYTEMFDRGENVYLTGPAWSAKLEASCKLHSYLNRSDKQSANFLLIFALL